MREKILFLLRYYLFWLILSVVAKVLFLVYQGGDTFTLQAGDYWNIFWRGLRMDFSLGGYVMLLACVLMVSSPWVKDRILRNVFSILTFVLLIFFWFVVTVDLELFKNWGYHIDSTPLLYLKTPKEAMASTPVWLSVILILLFILLTVFSFYFYRRFIGSKLKYKPGGWLEPVILLVIGALMIIPVRGGFNVAPMNSSFVFFHENSMFANQSAINPVWNFIYEVSHMNKLKNKYEFMPQEQAQNLVDSVYAQKGDFPHLLNKQRPNVVVLLLESFTANAIEVLGGASGVTPNLNELAKEGVLFSNIYATGNRSDRGMVGVISAYPSYPSFAMIKYPNKTAARPRFPKNLEADGYTTRFYYAGDINFGSFRSYVTMSFQDMVTENNFSGEAQEKRFKWGIHDEFMFRRLFEDMQSASQPFMYMAFNMSSHEPFDVPMETQIRGNDDISKFKNSIYYSDKCIGEFIAKCKESGLWDNTLFILVADHGSLRIGNLEVQDPKAYHIPVILAGGALNTKGLVVETIGSQTDVAATLLAQLGMDHSAYKYSRNLLAKDDFPFAFYSYSNAAAVVSNAGVSIMDLKSYNFMQGDTLTRNKDLLKAYLQVLDHDVNK